MNVLIDGSDFVIRFIPLPPHVHGFVTYDSEARANIYINRDLDRREQHQTIMHELIHVERDDAFSHDDLTIIESQ